jgi:lincosamide nucleotidyltransferase A/C/D/E
MTGSRAMSATDVLEVMAAFRDARIEAWIAGGWAVDSLIGEQTRPHRDLDLAVRADHLDRAISTLRGLGYRRALDLRPVRLVMHGRGGRAVDLHPVAFDARGHGRQAGDGDRVFEYPPDGFGSGAIDGVVVPCLTAEQLVRFHLGYEPQDHDRHDMAQLRDRLRVDVPAPY